MSAEVSTTRLDLGTGGDPADVLLKARGVKKYFPVKKGMLQRTVGQLQAVDGVDLDVFRGETVGLVGESGCGKSTSAAPAACSSPLPARSSSTGRRAASRRLRHEGDAPGHADRLPGLRRLARPAHERQRSRRGGPEDPRARAQAPRRGRDRVLERVGLSAEAAGAIRTSSAAASASGSASRAPSCCDRSSSSRTSRCPRSTSRSSRRC